MNSIVWSIQRKDGVKGKKNMLLGGRSEGHLLLHKDEWIIHSGFVFQSPVFIDWRCFKFALIHSKLLWLKKRFVWAKIKRVKFSVMHMFTVFKSNTIMKCIPISICSKAITYSVFLKIILLAKIAQGCMLPWYKWHVETKYICIYSRTSKINKHENRLW